MTVGQQMCPYLYVKLALETQIQIEQALWFLTAF